MVITVSISSCRFPGPNLRWVVNKVVGLVLPNAKSQFGCLAVLHGDNRFNFFLTFGTAKPTVCYNVHT